MASNDPGLAAVPIVDDPNTAGDPTAHNYIHKPSFADAAALAQKENAHTLGKGVGEKETAINSPPSSDDIIDASDEQPVAPDQFLAGFETSRREIWAYYAYYIGNNGLTLFNFAPTAFQNLLSEAAGDSGIINFAGGDRTINSVVLLCNGISFAIQIVLFLVIGSYAGKFPSPSYQSVGEVGVVVEM